jgi:hypothetical protein
MRRKDYLQSLPEAERLTLEDIVYIDTVNANSNIKVNINNYHVESLTVDTLNTTNIDNDENI